jgi:hypothetical protein
MEFHERRISMDYLGYAQIDYAEVVSLGAFAHCVS